MHSAFMDLFGVQMDARCAGYAHWRCGGQLLRPAGFHATEHPDGTQWSGLAKIFGVRRAHQGSQRGRVCGSIHTLFV